VPSLRYLLVATFRIYMFDLSGLSFIYCKIYFNYNYNAFCVLYFNITSRVISYPMLH